MFHVGRQCLIQSGGLGNENQSPEVSCWLLEKSVTTPSALDIVSDWIVKPLTRQITIRRRARCVENLNRRGRAEVGGRRPRTQGPHDFFVGRDFDGLHRRMVRVNAVHRLAEPVVDERVSVRQARRNLGVGKLVFRRVGGRPFQTVSPLRLIREQSGWRWWRPKCCRWPVHG